MTSKNGLFFIRDAVEGDYTFIYATFLRGLYYGDESFKRVDKDLFMENYHYILDHMLHIEGINIKMCVLSEDPEVILGYAVYKGPRLDWVFVKKAWRKIGIAKSLVPSDITTVSHLTTVGEAILKTRPTIKFNPFDVD